ncbi:MAG: RNA-binding protein [Phycisphaerales bacterium]|nr:MAG: RNA-binding protein [Phycisphaerales bacterium]
MKRIYIGNLAHDATEERVEAAFASFGFVESVSIVRNRHTGESWGYGFVEMANDAEAGEAIAGLNGTRIDGSTVRVEEARSQAPRVRRFPGGGDSHGRGWRR